MFVNLERNTNLKARLRKFIGTGAMPCREVASLTGIPVRTVQSHIGEDGSLPNLSHLMAYAHLFGSSFLNNIFGPEGFVTMDVRAGQKVCQRQFLTATAGYLHTYARIMEDGRIDHQEARVVVPLTRQFCADGLALAAQVEKAHAA